MSTLLINFLAIIYILIMIFSIIEGKYYRVLYWLGALIIILVSKRIE